MASVNDMARWFAEARAMGRERRRNLKRIGIGIAPQERREFEWLTNKLLEAMRKTGTKSPDHPAVGKQVDKIRRWSEAHPEAWEFLAGEYIETTTLARRADE